MTIYILVHLAKMLLGISKILFSQGCKRHGDSLRAAAQMELKGFYPNITLCIFPYWHQQAIRKDEKLWSLISIYFIPNIEPQQASLTMKPSRESTINSPYF